MKIANGYLPIFARILINMELKKRINIEANTLNIQINKNNTIILKNNIYFTNK